MPAPTAATRRGDGHASAPTLGLRANLPQFVLLVAVNALVGGMLGQERTVLPLLAAGEFGQSAYTAALTFIAAFGLSKAAANYAAGTWSDRYGRKPVLVAGWLVAVPVPLLLIWAPTWTWVIVANILLGISQGLTWSTTVVMKIDISGPARRGLAMGLNEAAGYGAVAATALATGYIAAHAGLRPEPSYLGIAFAALGLGASVVVVRETRGHAHHEAAGSSHACTQPAFLSNRDIFARTSWQQVGRPSGRWQGPSRRRQLMVARKAIPSPAIPADSSMGRMGRAVNRSQGAKAVTVRASVAALSTSMRATPPSPSANP